LKKLVVIAAVLVSISLTAIGQTSTQITQNLTVSLTDAIEITFTSNSSSTGPTVTMTFNNTDDYASGIESADQELKVRSNRNFTVQVKANSTNFSYSGSASPTPTMPVSGVLLLKVTANSTGGSIASPFSASSYSTLTSSNQNLISSGTRGGNKTFSIKYNATPGFLYPGGTYTADVVYTATQQ
jgi:hypothetical protein